MTSAPTPPGQSSSPPPSVPPGPSRGPHLTRSWLSSRLPLLVGAVFGGVVILVLILMLALRPLFLHDQTAGIPLVVTRLSGPGPLPSPLTPPTPSAPPVVDVGGTQISLPVPQRLNAGSLSYPIQATTPGATDTWATPEERPGAAIWVHGTVINYVLGLEPTAENQEMLEGLQRGDPLLLDLSNGTRLTFRVRSSQETSRDDPAIFAQAEPGLTLVLLSEGEQQRVVRAEFEATTAPTPAPEESPTEVGPVAPAAVPDVQIDQAFLGENGEVLHIVAVITNRGDEPLTVRESDIEISSSAGPGVLQTTAPLLPWTLSPGQTRDVELQFTRPEADTCVVTILGYTFEISGMN
jgi:hypothetical protein